MKHANISLFVPHMGCPHQCSFCNQKTISGSVKPLTADEVTATLNQAVADGVDPENTEVAFFGGSLAIKGSVTIGSLTTLLSYANQYTKPFNEISGVITELQNAIACLERVFGLIYEEEYIEDAKTSFSDHSGTVEFKNVYFSYSPDKPLIEDFSLKVNAGETIAIVGPKRMEYDRVVGLLEYMKDNIER